MKSKPKFDLIYLIILIAVVFFLAKHKTLNTGTLLTYLAFFDIVLGFAFIIKGFISWDMSYIFTGAFCALCSYYAYKEMSDAALLFLILGGLVGIGNHLRKTFKNTLG